MTMRRSIAAPFLLVSLVAVTAQYYKPRIGNSTVLLLQTLYDANPISTVQCNKYKYFAVNFVYPCADLIISLRVSSGQPDIYVSKADVDLDPYPTKDKLTWSAFADDLFSLTISRWDPESAPGYYYIGIYNDCSKQSRAATFRIQAVKSQDLLVTTGVSDILLYPALGMKQTVVANGYQFFRFCVPKCANVRIDLHNCMNNTVCPRKYSYPELLVSRHALNPNIQDYSYKLASIARRHVWVNHTDPSGRDSNGYSQGSYYVAVFGYCTPDAFVQDPTQDGPCSYAALTKFNLTVSIIPNPVLSAYGECPEISAALLTPPAPTTYPEVLSGVPVHGNIGCTQNGPMQYKYFTLKVPRPCNNLVIQLNTTGSSPFNTAELAVGKYPNIAPTFDNIEWTSYNKGNQTMFISAFDPAFDGGMVCGADGKSECVIYIGVTGYCITAVTSLNFILKATLEPLGNNIFAVAEKNQIIAPNGVNKYEFCVDDAVDVKAQLKSFTSACDCPKSYANLEYVISRTNVNATINDLTWKYEGGGGDETGIVKLLESDADTRPGTYYLNVLGTCTLAANCDNACTCGPCANLAHSPYSLYIANSSSLMHHSNASLSTGSCPAVKGTTVLGGLTGVCAATCPSVAVSSPASLYTQLLNAGGKAAIAIVVILVCLSILGCGLCYFRRRLICCQKQTRQEFSSLRDAKVPLFESGEPVVIQI